MADFNAAYDIVKKWEGGYANITLDKGGETMYGISRKFFPEWEGWKVVDANKPLKQGAFLPDSKIYKYVHDFYRINFWNKMNGDKIQDQKVANFIFDWFVNSGRTALKYIQRSIGIEDDGIVGAKTIETINNHGSELVETLKMIRVDLVKNIVKNNPSQKMFLGGWLARINSF